MPVAKEFTHPDTGGQSTNTPSEYTIAFREMQKQLFVFTFIVFMGFCIYHLKRAQMLKEQALGGGG